MRSELRPGTWWRLRRLSDAAGRFKMLAVDQRPPLKTLVRSRLGETGDETMTREVARLKLRLVETLGPHVTAVLADPHYAYPAAFHALDPKRGLLLTLEDSIFEETPRGRLSRPIDDWSVGKIAAAGADGVKVLAWYRPDAAPEVREHQQRFVAEVGAACRRFDVPYVLELLTYPMPGERGHTTDYAEAPNKKTEHVLESVETFAAPDYGVDLFKLESPVPADVVAAGGEDPQAAFDDLGRAAGRPWVMLSAGTSRATFKAILGHAYRAGASGYLAGRAIWWPAVDHYPDDSAIDAELIGGCVSYTEELNRLTDETARPWWGEDGPPRLDAIGPDFRHRYEEPAP